VKFGFPSDIAYAPTMPVWQPRNLRAIQQRLALEEIDCQNVQKTRAFCGQWKFP
jgi:hypothetical protein